MHICMDMSLSMPMSMSRSIYLFLKNDKSVRSIWSISIFGHARNRETTGNREIAITTNSA